MATVQLVEGRIDYIQDLVGTTVATAFPSGATAGKSLTDLTSKGTVGSRVHVLARLSVTTGTLSGIVTVYGYNATTGHWAYIGGLNGAASIAADTNKWSPDASTAVLAESFAISGKNYDRFATRYLPGGLTTAVVSTWVGFPVE